MAEKAENLRKNIHEATEPEKEKTSMAQRREQESRSRSEESRSRSEESRSGSGGAKQDNGGDNGGNGDDKESKKEREDALKARITETFNAGGLTLRDDEARFVADKLKLEVQAFEPPEESPTKGLTPATGSNGMPYRSDAATDETKDYAKEQEKLAEDRDPDPNPVALGNARRLVAATKEK